MRKWFKNDFGEPFECTPYQADFLRDVFNKKHKKYIFCASTRCIEENEYIYTPNGIKKVKHLQPGDITLDGKVSNIHKFKDEIYEITFRGNTKIKVNGAHPFFMRKSANWSKTRWITARDIFQRYPIKSRHNWKVQFQNSKGFKFDEIAVGKDKAKLLGYLMSDGYFSETQSIKFTNINEDFLKEVENFAIELGYPPKRYKKGNGYDISITGQHGTKVNALKDELRKLGIINRNTLGDIQKFCKEDLKEFLCGYFNGDGCLSIIRGYPRIYLECGIHENMAYEMQFILWRLGVLSKITYDNRGEGKGNWRVLVFKKEDIKKMLTFLEDKKYPEKFKRARIIVDSLSTQNDKQQDNNGVWLPVTNIKKIGKGNVIGYATDTAEITSYMGMRTHNSGKSEIIAIAVVMLAIFYPGEEILVISASFKQAQIIFTKIRIHVSDSPEIYNLVDRRQSFTKEEIHFKNGSRGKCLSAGNPEGLLGFGGSIVIVDESGSIDDDTYYTRVLRMITTGRRDRILIESGCVTEDTLILSDKGFRNIGKHSLGYTKCEEKLYGIDGFHSTEQKYGNGKSDTIRIKTNAGFELEGTPNHKLMTNNGWKRLDEFKKEDWIAIQRGQRIWNKGFSDKSFTWNKRTSAKEIEITMDKDLAYLFGLYLAEGCIDTTRITISNTDKEIIDFLKLKYNFILQDDVHSRLTSSKMMQYLLWFGFKKQKAPLKEIPIMFYSLPQDLQIEFLRGYFDGDGFNSGHTVGCDSSSENLLKQMQVILLNFGIVSRRYKTITKPTERVKKECVCWRIRIEKNLAKKFHKEIGFRLSRKKRSVKVEDTQERIPFDYEELKEGRELTQGWHYLKRCKTITYPVLKKFLEKYPNSKYNTILKDNYYYDKVKTIIPSTNNTHDFVIPETHSYFSNGFISHNTPHRPNHFKETWVNPNYSKYKVTWRQAVKAGQMSEEEVLQIKERMTEMEFQMWYMAEFPEEGEDQLIKLKDFTSAREKGEETEDQNEDNDYYLGVDVARFGIDKTVFTVLEYCKDTREYILREVIAIDRSDLMQVAGRIVALDFSYKFKEIVVDDTGLGGGVTDRLKEQTIGSKVRPVNFGSKAVGIDADRFANLKSQIFINMQDMFKKQMIVLTPHRYAKRQGDEILWMRYKFSSTGKIQIVDPGEKGADGSVVGRKKSPDFADSLALALFREITGRMMILKDSENILGLG